MHACVCACVRVRARARVCVCVSVSVRACVCAWFPDGVIPSDTAGQVAEGSRCSATLVRMLITDKTEYIVAMTTRSVRCNTFAI